MRSFCPQYGDIFEIIWNMVFSEIMDYVQIERSCCVFRDGTLQVDTHPVADAYPITFSGLWLRIPFYIYL